MLTNVWYGVGSTMSGSNKFLELARQGLVLKLSDTSAPFQLGEKEVFFPDDWAWMFLRLNAKYIAEFKKHAVDGLKEASIKYFLQEDLTQDVYKDTDGMCRKEFGLAAWLDPENTILPTLINGGSWFFPLKCPVSENIDRTVVNAELFIRKPGPRYAMPSYLEPNETPFGYRTTRTDPRRIGLYNPSWELTKVAIDCSIPPEGQISALADLVEKNRKYLQGLQLKTHDDFDPPRLLDVTSEEIFRDMSFESSFAGSKDKEAASFWRAICIDALGPTGIQIKEYLKLLRAKHQEFLEIKSTQSPLPERFSTTLTTTVGEDIGSRQKAILMIAELDQGGYEAHEIEEVLCVVGDREKDCKTWQTRFAERINDYIDEGRRLVKGDYRWFVHGQKPDY